MLPLQTADANFGQGRFIDESAKSGHHSRLHVDVSIIQQNGWRYCSRMEGGMIAREPVCSVRVFLLHT
jgi:hypothetical protein